MILTVRRWRRGCDVDMILTVRIHSTNDGSVIAECRGEDWIDPYGGTFTAEEKTWLDSCASGSIRWFRDQMTYATVTIKRGA